MEWVEDPSTDDAPVAHPEFGNGGVGEEVTLPLGNDEATGSGDTAQETGDDEDGEYIRFTLGENKVGSWGFKIRVEGDGNETHETGRYDFAAYCGGDSAGIVNPSINATDSTASESSGDSTTQDAASNSDAWKSLYEFEISPSNGTDEDIPHFDIPPWSQESETRAEICPITKYELYASEGDTEPHGNFG